MTVLVTGADGFVGRRLVQRLRAAGRDVMGWTRADADLLDADSVRRAMADVAPALIFHLAASSVQATDEVDSDEAMVRNIASAAPGHARIVMAGSMAEYGYAGVHGEDAPRQPVTAYGRAKAAAVDAAMALHHAGAPVMVARLFGVYGPGEAPRRLVPHLVKALRAGQEVPLSDGRQVRDFIHVDDVCQVLMALGDAAALPHAVVNIGTGQGVSVADVCRSVAAALGADAALLRFGELPRRAVDEELLVADVTRLASLTAVPPQRWRGPAEAIDAMVADIAAA